MQLLGIYLATIVGALIGSAANAAAATTDRLPKAVADLATGTALEELAAAVAAAKAAAPGSTISTRDVNRDDIGSSHSRLHIAPCNINASNRNECIKGLFQQLVPKLKNGLPEYGMGSIDPYFFRRGIFRYDNEGVQGGLLIKNMHINGISTLNVNNVFTNFTGDDFLIKVSIDIPKLKAGGHFKADVKFGGLRLVPKGPFNITLDNVRATILADGAIQTVSNGQRLKLNRLNANIAISNANIVANGIFSDRNLNTMILNLVNENLPEIIRVGIPATREQWAPILVTHVNEFFANVPMEKFIEQ